MTLDKIIEKLKKDYESSQGRKNSSISRLYDLNFSDTSQILENSSFLFYEFENKGVEFEHEDSEGEMGKYTRTISPLFVSDVIESENNNKLLNIIDEEVPFYHLQPENSIEDMSLQDLSSTRDCGVNNVHSALRDNSFYQIWLRDVFGSIQNQLILDSYNKMRWPVLLENQYLMAGLFPSLALESFNQGDSENTKTLIEFKDTSEENTQDNNYSEKIDGSEISLHNETGCIDYLNDIIEGRLESTYAILDYHPGKTDVIYSWGQSLYESGRIKEEDLKKELVVYKLQDIKYELLKRKYAGSRTLYNITLASLDRQGSLISAMPIGDTKFKETSDEYFLDKRLLRILDIPGVTSSYEQTEIYPLDFIANNGTSISLNDISSIYYESGSDYDAENFFNGENASFGEESRAVLGNISLLRKNKKYLNWNCLSGISKGQITSSIYNTLDEKKDTSWVTVDNQNPKDSEGNPLIKSNGETAKYSFLDYKVPSINISSSSGSILRDILDISANRLLFNSNTLQQELGQEYPYITYPIANNNSVSLLDPDWIEYIQSSIETKSKIQDNIFYGAQLNKYFKLSSTRLGEYSFFAISYSKEEFTSKTLLLENIKEKNQNPEGANFAYLWYCTVKYDASSFEVKALDTKVISKITLQINDEEDKFQDIEEYESLKGFSKGILPFTYFKISDDSILGIQYGERGENGWGDDLNRLGYSKAYYIFSESDSSLLLNPGSLASELEIKEYISKHEELTVRPTSNTKVVYYVVQKSDSNFIWSSPIKVLNLGGALPSIGDTFYPDEYALCYFLNPYLNFTKNSASPLRNKRVFSTEKSVDSGLKEIVKEVSDNIYLSNLTRFRGRDFLCCDKDENISRWISFYKENHPAQSKVGFYLEKYSEDVPEDKTEALENLNTANNALAIYGDPRTLNLYDFKEEQSTGENGFNYRSEVYIDPSTGIKCLHFESKLTEDYSERENLTYEYLKLRPSGVTTSNEEDRYGHWYWNEDVEGRAICFAFSLNKENPRSGIYENPILMERENCFALSLSFKEETGSPKFKVVFSYLNKYSVESELLDFSSSIIRVGVSIKKGEKPLLIVNDSISEGKNVIETLSSELKSVDPLYIGISSDIKTGCFLGNIYDIRLYNVGFSKGNLRIISQGSFRELFSYSPDIYVLGYNNYIDLGIFKEVSERKGVEGDPTAIDEVSSIRAFNRSVWDSSLIERSPIFEEETEPTSPFYREDAENPEEDSDVYGWVNGRRTLSDCVEINLKGIEALNNRSLSLLGGELTPIIYNSEEIKISESDKTTILDTMIYPVFYKKEIMKNSTSNSFKLDSSSGKIQSEGNGLMLPVALKSTDGNIKYEADFSLNFTIDTTSDFTNFYSKGSNISLVYNNLLERAVITKNETEKNSSYSNHILIPLTVPRQKKLSSNNIGYFDRFYLSNVELNKGINTLLQATSYYNELRIPVAFDVVVNKERGVTYASKWDALRTLKEGTYYITCKYPFQILPFEDSLYDTTNAAKYDYLYASVRFKIEVSGKPLTYETGKNGAEDITSSYKSAYCRDNIISTLKSTSSLLNPEDNRTFPHREINIDLYVQDSSTPAGKMYKNLKGTAEEAYDYSWKLLGTNHPEDYANKDNCILLTRQTLENALTVSTDIPAFFSKNLTSPFFIAKSEKMANGESRVNSTSADDDLIDPIRINPIYNASKMTSYVKASGIAIAGVNYYIKDRSSYYLADPQPEAGESVEEETYYTRIESLDNLQVGEEKDLDNLVLVAGRAYKLLWDYSGYISELSFTDNIYSNTSVARISLASTTSETPSYKMTSSEKKNFARLVNLIEDSTSERKSSYSYTENGAGYRVNDTQLSGKTSGYRIADGEYITCYVYSLGENETLDSSFIKKWLTNPVGITIGGNTYTCVADSSLTEYSLISVSNEENIPNSIPSGVLYKVEGTSNYYFGSKEQSQIEGNLGLDESSWSSLNLGAFYLEPNSGKIYRSGVELKNVIFKQGDSYYVWDNFDKVSVVLDEGTYVSERYCPQEGDRSKVYASTVTGIFFRYINSDAPYFTEISATSSERIFSGDDFYFGNPYSRSSENNYLLSIRDASSSYSRNNIINSYYFPYVPTEIPENQYLSARLLTSQTPLEVKVSSAGDTTQIVLDEKEILKTQHEAIWNSVSSSLKSLINCNSGSSQGSVDGIFTALSTIKPNYYYSQAAGAVKETYVRSASDDLISYLSADRTYPSKNENILITRRGLYSNNLLVNQDFDNSLYWTWGEAQNLLGLGQSSSTNLYYETYVSDDDWDDGEGKDVCEVTYIQYGDGNSSNSENPLTVKYTKGSSIISAAYEIALNVKVLGKQKGDDGTWVEKQPSFYMWVESEDGTAYIFTDVTKNVKYLDFWPKEGSYGDEEAIVVRKEELLAKGYKGNNIYSLTLDQYGKKNSPASGDSKLSTEITDTEKKILYVDSKANDVTIYATFMAKGRKVGDPMRLCISSLSQGEDVKGLAAFDDQWYTISTESEAIIAADSVAFEFVCDEAVKFRITKAVVRKSNSRTHVLGLSDGLYTKKTSSSASGVMVASHHSIAYRNKETHEIIPVQFNAVLSQRQSTSNYTSSNIIYPISGLSNVSDFRNEYSLGYETSSMKIEKLMDPWKRRFYYNRSTNSNVKEVYFNPVTGGIFEEYYNSNGYDESVEKKGYVFRREVTPQEGIYYYFLNGSNEEMYVKNSEGSEGEDAYISQDSKNGNYYTYDSSEKEFKVCSGGLPFIETSYFRGYETKKDNTGIRIEKEGNLSTRDIYTTQNIEYNSSAASDRDYISISDLSINTSANSAFNKYSTNLRVTESSDKTSRGEIIKAGPIMVSNIKVSALTNCFNSKKLRNGEDSNAVVTNLQLMGVDENGAKRVMYEIEYPPVIYKENDQHLSLNIYLHKTESSVS